MKIKATFLVVKKKKKKEFAGYEFLKDKFVYSFIIYMKNVSPYLVLFEFFLTKSTTSKVLETPPSVNMNITLGTPFLLG